MPSIDEEKSGHQSVFDRDATVQDWDDDYYHPIAESYYDKAIPWLLQAMGAGEADRVLDAGCGPGVHSIRAARYGCEVDSVDVSPTMLRHAERRVAAAGLSEKINFMHGDLTKLSLDRQYQFVFSWGVIIHIPEVDDVVENLASVVAPGGSLGLQILSNKSLDFRLEKAARKLLGKPFKEMEDGLLGTGVWYELNDERLWVMRFDLDALDKRMRSLGFEPVVRQTAEFSEFQRKLSGPVRSGLLWLNRLMYRIGVLTPLSATQMLVYRKRVDAKS